MEKQLKVVKLVKMVWTDNPEKMALLVKMDWTVFKDHQVRLDHRASKENQEATELMVYLVYQECLDQLVSREFRVKKAIEVKTVLMVCPVRLAFQVVTESMVYREHLDWTVLQVCPDHRAKLDHREMMELTALEDYQD